ncbi:MAG: hypothetical protein AAFY22_00350 [Pseudomonadota bacterium]
MSDDASERLMDAEEHRRSYNTIMGFSTKYGVSAALALAMFFTQLTLGAGFASVIWAIAVFFGSLFVVKAFFSH